MTDKKTEALKLALEGLEKWHFDKDPRGAADYITAIREALAEQPAQQDQGQSCYCPECERLSKELAALKAQQQEPVAWRDPNNVDPGQGCTYDKANHEKWPHIYTQPLYTSPPASKPWVSLTDEDIEKLSVEAGKATFLNDDEQTGILWFDGDCVCLARAIEAKLREKNA